MTGTWLPVLVSFNRLPLDGVMAVCLVITDLTEHKHNRQLQDTIVARMSSWQCWPNQLAEFALAGLIANAAQMLACGTRGPTKRSLTDGR